MKKSKSTSKRKSATQTRGKAAKPLRDLKVTKTTGVRGGMIVTEDYGTANMVEL